MSKVNPNSIAEMKPTVSMAPPVSQSMSWGQLFIDFLPNFENFTLTMPDAVTGFYFNAARFSYFDPRIVRLISLVFFGFVFATIIKFVVHHYLTNYYFNSDLSSDSSSDEETWPNHESIMRTSDTVSVPSHWTRYINPSKINRACRIVFPMSFLVFNLFYFYTYLSRAADRRAAYINLTPD